MSSLLGCVFVMVVVGLGVWLSLSAIPVSCSRICGREIDSPYKAFV